MFPVLAAMYWRLSLNEEREAEAQFADEYRRYALRTPRFIPHLGLRRQSGAG